MSYTIDEMRERVRQQYGDGIPERSYRDADPPPARGLPHRKPGAPRRPCKGVPTEHEIQVALIDRVRDPANQREHPELALLFAIPSGGYRSPRTAGRLHAEGVQPGVPDLCLPVSRGGYHGLWIEMKRPGGTTSPAQASWLAQLAKEGYRVALHSTVDGAWTDITDYLALPLSPAT